MLASITLTIVITALLCNFTLGFRVRQDKIFKWENATVPYQLSNSFTTDEITVISKVLQEISQKTCIKFVPAKTQTDLVRIQKGGLNSQCHAALGRVGGVQVINLEGVLFYPPDEAHSCIRHGPVAYQVMKTLGFYPEHLRPDRDEYVEIILANIKPSKRSAFEKYSVALFDLSSLPYDYGSVTHGKLNRFAKEKGDMTIIPTRYGVSIGQNHGLSDGDIQKINHVYCQSANRSSLNTQLLLFAIAVIVKFTVY